MISPQAVHRDGPQRAFLVERYLSPAAAHELARWTTRTAALCVGREHPDADVQYLYSAYLPTEDTCFCLFRASSVDAVRAVNVEADFALDRITDAELFLYGSTDGQSFRRPSTS